MLRQYMDELESMLEEGALKAAKILLISPLPRFLTKSADPTGRWDDIKPFIQDAYNKLKQVADSWSGNVAVQITYFEHIFSDISVYKTFLNRDDIHLLPTGSSLLAQHVAVTTTEWCSNMTNKGPDDLCPLASLTRLAKTTYGFLEQRKNDLGTSLLNPPLFDAALSLGTKIYMFTF